MELTQVKKVFVRKEIRSGGEHLCKLYEARTETVYPDFQLFRREGFYEKETLATPYNQKNGQDNPEHMVYPDR